MNRIYIIIACTIISINISFCQANRLNGYSLISYLMNDTAIVNGANITHNMKGICIGDVNGSYNYFPTGAKGAKVKLISNQSVKLVANEYYDLPIIINENVNVSAISLILDYSFKNAEIINITKIFNDDTNLVFNIVNNQLRIGWYMDSIAQQFNNGDTLFKIRIKTSSNFKQGDNIKFDIANNVLVEFADGNTNPINEVKLITNKIEFDNAKANAPITTISSSVACPNSIVTLHVTATNVVSIAGVNFELDYDGAVLSYIDPNPTQQIGNFHNTNPVLYSYGGDFLVHQNNPSPNLRNVRCFWSTYGTNVSYIPSTVGGVANLFDLTFWYYGGTTEIYFNNSGGNTGGGGLCEWTNKYGTPYNDKPDSNYYNNGYVTECINTINNS